MAAPLTRCACPASIKNRLQLLTRTLTVKAPLLQSAQAQTDSQTSDSRRIVLPKKKTREATAVLRALRETLPKDYGAPHYMYTDDPFLAPASAMEKRTYSLSKASGRRAAEWVMAQLPEKFTLNEAEPAIEAFMPVTPPVHQEDTVEGLLERIEMNDPLGAFNAYQALKQAGVEVPTPAVEDLLGLLCFYNSEDPSQQLVEEEQFYKRDIGTDTGKLSSKTWKGHGPAEQVFTEMKIKTPRAHLELLKGRAKYNDAERVWALYQEMKQGQVPQGQVPQDGYPGVPLTEEVYREVLSVANFMSDSATGRWQFMMDVLKEMAARDVTPTLGTFNVVLQCLTRNTRYRETNDWAMSVLQEMRNNNIEPSLASYFYIVRIVYNSEEVTSNILSQIVDHLEGRQLEAHEPADYEFFAAAMPKCYNNVKDLELAYKIDALLNTGTNFLLLGDGYKQSIYYTFFLKTLCMFEQIDKIMEQYGKMTPHTYTPTFSAYEDLLRAVELNEGYEYLPQIWSDMVLFDYSKRTDLIEALLQIMGKRKQPDQLQDLYIRVTAVVREKFEEEKRNTRSLRPFQLNGDMIGNIIQINLHGDNYDNAWEFYELYNGNKMSIEKFPSESSLVALAEASIERGNAERTLSIVQLMADCAYTQVDVVAGKATRGLHLTQQQTDFIDDLL